MATNQLFTSAYKINGTPTNGGGISLIISTNGADRIRSNVTVTDNQGTSDNTSVLGDIATDAITTTGMNNTSAQYWGTATVGGVQGMIIFDPNGGGSYWFLSNATATQFTGASSGTASQSSAGTNTWVLAGTTTPVAPVVSGVTDDAGAQQGPVSNGGATNDPTLTFAGTAGAGQLITIRNTTTNTVLGTTTADSSGKWTITTSPLGADGTKNLSVVASQGGQTSSATSYSVTLDTQAPTQTISGVAVTDNVPSGSTPVANNGSTNDATPTISGTLSATLAAGETVKVYDGATLLGTATVTGNSWSFTSGTLSNGAHTLTARVEDAAGNQGAPSATFTINVDTVTPSAPTSGGTIAPTMSGAEAAAGATFTFNAAPGSTVTVSFDGTGADLNSLVATETAPGSGVFEVTLTPAQLLGLGEGAVTLSATATDGAGNTSVPFTSSFDLDTVADDAPAATVEFTDNDPTPTATKITVTGLDADATGVVQVLDGDDNLVDAFSVSANGTFARDLSAHAGETLKLKLAITDDAGNTAEVAGETDVICFYPGTLVATPAGEVAVEALRTGDLVLTADGRAVPVRWMGRQTVSSRFGDPLRVLPIRIKAGALGEGVPRRDLLVSPGHAMLVGGVLVQAGALVNGTSILRERDVPQTFTYWHVEVADHSLILAEGAPAETFMDNADREAFDNWAEYQAIVGDEAPIPEMDLPRAKSHRQVPQAVRALIAARAEALSGEAAVAA